MLYKYSKNENYEDFACGRVIYNMKGSTNFPVRLAQEIFMLCLYHSVKKDDISLYDPCCGNGYTLIVLGLMNSGILSAVTGSDIDENAVRSAKRNLDLLTRTGMNDRISQLEKLYKNYRKSSHKEALESAIRLAGFIKDQEIKSGADESGKLQLNVFQSDILSDDVLAGKDFKADIVITDVPYGNLAAWSDGKTNETDILLHNIKHVLHKESIVAICSDKKQKISTDEYVRLEKQIIGKRKFEIFKLRKQKAKNPHQAWRTDKWQKKLLTTLRRGMTFISKIAIIAHYFQSYCISTKALLL